MMTTQSRHSSSSCLVVTNFYFLLFFCFLFLQQHEIVDGFSTTSLLNNNKERGRITTTKTIAGRCIKNVVGSFDDDNNNEKGKIEISTTTTALNSVGNSNDNNSNNDDDYIDDEDDDDDDDDEIIDDSNLGDWRKFRASLIDDGLPDVEGSSSIKQKQQQDEQQQASKTTKSKKKKSVAIQNEELLQKQNSELANEYCSGVWAHTINQIEIGGLICRMPIEAEIYYYNSSNDDQKTTQTTKKGYNNNYWKEKLDIMIKMDDNNINNKMNNDNDNDGNDDEGEEGDPDQLNTAKVEHWFNIADRMITRELQSITNSGKVKNGILDPNDLDENERNLMDKYLDYKNTWQEICLVLSDNPTTGCSEAVIINRPITKNINKEIAKMILEGSTGTGRGNFAYDFIDKVVQAFGTEAGVYMGGPDRQDEPALLIHGISDIPGSIEISPGTGIYRGGLEGAVDGILDGKYRPLDFRFFIGRQFYDPARNPQRGILSQKIHDGKYQPVACARSVALKQCLGLPKPLWHEVLELCGGELKSLSSIELKKRVDLQ